MITKTKHGLAFTHEELGLASDTLQEMYHIMLLARKLDERMWMLHRQGRVAFHISGIGQEGAQVGMAFNLKPGYDWVHPYYRDIALMLGLGMQPRELMLGLFGKRDDPSSGGRQMPAHFGNRRLNIVTGSSPVATQIPQAAGIALAAKLRREDTVVLTTFGEGSTSEGDFHEGLNWAGIHRLPVIFFCQNNQYAISCPQDQQMAVENVADRAAGYGIPGVVVDGNDVLAMYHAARQAVERARAGQGSTLLEAKTYRPVPHSSDDDDRSYRDREEVVAWKKRDPILRFEAYLEERGLLGAELKEEMLERVMAEVDDATQHAQSAPDPEPEDALGQVWGPVPEELREE
jgi:2-oxoisovalerate dehydrogenase E1 component alpha subunit